MGVTRESRAATSTPRSWRRLVAWGAAAALALGGVAIGTAFVLLRVSLAQLDGTTTLEGLQTKVTITRDALGVPSIQAESRTDALRALGFLHAQERFFQMDLLRRRGAGELAALIGPPLIEHDRAVRRHRLRAAAIRELQTLPDTHRTLLAAYTAGVNEGLRQLRARPPEYWALQTLPEPWRPEDTLLISHAMSFTLQDSEGVSDLVADRLASFLPREVIEFLFPARSAWDAAIDGSELPAPPMPGPESFDLRTNLPAAALPPEGPSNREPGPVPGSNSWGVPGALTDTGAAMVANDMHLDLGLPNIWFRAEIRWKENDGSQRRLVGATLPGVPTIIVGSNGDIAWGFTNATLDTSDLVELETDPSRPDFYRTPEGWRALETFTENIAVRGAAHVIETYETSIWGPLPPRSSKAPRHALCWIAHHPGAANLRLLDLAVARTTDEAIALAPNIGIPAQNLLVGDRLGNLAWTLIGRVPNRIGVEADARPTSWATGTRRWDGWLPAAEYPVHRARSNGFWTANHRISGAPVYLALGVHTTDAGARATQIRDHLLALPAPVRETDLMGIHRDDRALFLARWQALLLETLASSAEGMSETRRREFHDAVARWGGRAATNSAGYRLVRDFRYQTIQRVMQPFFDRTLPADTNALALPLLSERNEDACWKILHDDPAHLRNPAFTDRAKLLADAARATLERVAGATGAVEVATWGQRNLSRIQHPLSRGVPQLAPYLDLPREPLPGDDHMPRVQGPQFGASERMVVSPSREESGLFHMPGGQSGHFLSPFYRAGHRDWVEVAPSPLLPGPTRHTLTLQPATPLPVSP